MGFGVVWLMGEDSLGSSCGQCSVLIRGRAVLGGVFASWCVNFPLDQKIEQIHPIALPVAVTIAREATVVAEQHLSFTLCMVAPDCV